MNPFCLLSPKKTTGISKAPKLGPPQTQPTPDLAQGTEPTSEHSQVLENRPWVSQGPLRKLILPFRNGPLSSQSTTKKGSQSQSQSDTQEGEAPPTVSEKHIGKALTSPTWKTLCPSTFLDAPNPCPAWGNGTGSTLASRRANLRSREKAFEFPAPGSLTKW